MYVYKNLRTAIINFFRHDCAQMAAATAYYMVFSLPAILLISVTVAGYAARAGALGERGEIEEQIVQEVEATVGPVTADQITELIKRTADLPPSPLSVAIGIVILLASASAVMVQLQSSLNTIWRVEPDSPRHRNRNFFVKRLLSLLLIFAIGLLLLLSVLISAVLAALGDIIHPILPEANALRSSWIISTASDLFISFLLFTAIYKWLPDTRVTWTFACLGGALTAVLFAIGKSFLGVLLTYVEIGSAYGAAGSLALLLAWFYYTVLIFLFGAELTRAIEVHHARNP